MTQIGYQSIIFFVVLFAAFLMSSRILAPQVQQGKNLDHSIEGLRGIACILVFINHAPWILHHNQITNNIIDFNLFSYFSFGSVGVELFFCITGFLFSSKIRRGEIDTSFYIKRVKRLAPAYLCVSLLVFVIFMFRYSDLLNGFNDFLSLIRQVFGFGFFGSGINIGNQSITSLNVVTWTLPYEWKFYAILPFMAVILKNRTASIAIIVFGAILLLCDYNENHSLWVYFISGFLASYIKPSKSKNVRILFSTLSIILFIACLSKPEEQYGIHKFIFVTLFFLCCIFSKPAFLQFKSLSVIGTISYGIYLIHQPLTNITLMVASKIVDLSSIDLTRFLFINVIIGLITVLLSTALYKHIERKFM